MDLARTSDTEAQTPKPYTLINTSQIRNLSPFARNPSPFTLQPWHQILDTVSSIDGAYRAVAGRIIALSRGLGLEVVDAGRAEWGRDAILATSSPNMVRLWTGWAEGEEREWCESWREEREGGDEGVIEGM
jgi:hypothetical protein